MALFASRRGTDESLPRDDRGVGHFNDYSYGLVARNKRITIVLADSDPHQEELRAILDAGDEHPETAISPRTREQERVDAPIVVRLFTGRRVSGPVGSVPRGLESVVDDTLRRLDDTVGKARIPARIVTKGGKLRVELLMGLVR
ncbi:hypothetical protein ACFPJ4_03680 [Lysinimonas soli]|uniref:Uncharacterized protein n=1 Tax=Lysinimonas soli TaxID=1074233 RepID=A0ABW0NR26_9MICO